MVIVGRLLTAIVASSMVVAISIPRAYGMEPEWGEPRSLDPENAEYLIDDRRIQLVDGVADTEMAPGAASRLRTTLLGMPVTGDLDGDGDQDAALLLVQEFGGSGAFYYAAVAQGADGATQGSNGIFLGDRIIVESVDIIGRTIVIHFVTRRPGQAMTVEPTERKVLMMGLRNDALVAWTPESASVEGALP